MKETPRKKTPPQLKKLDVNLTIYVGSSNISIELLEKMDEFIENVYFKTLFYQKMWSFVEAAHVNGKPIPSFLSGYSQEVHRNISWMGQWSLHSLKNTLSYQVAYIHWNVRVLC